MKSWLGVCLFAVVSLPALGQDDKPPQGAVDALGQTPILTPGHFAHGEAFNEGPRQHAYLMKGMGKVHFPITTKSLMAQKFFEQGVAQLHGFWYFEAERSFRQAAALDPECAMSYWGMAMANVNNDKRAKEFMQKALQWKSKTTEREQLWIDALNCMYDKREGKAAERKQRLYDFYRILHRVCRQYPDDLEAPAFLACINWENTWRDGKPLTPVVFPGFLDASMKAVLAKNPMHPLHHYRIHLWDGPKAKNALDSAARCGQSSPGIAHMWHMPGHIFSDLQRYHDAAWQQEAGVRVDNAQLIRDHILPDQIHNYAHNSEWLTRDLINVGRMSDAMTLAKNMIEMPRHPKYNTIEKGSSTSNYGRIRLLQVLSTFELWDETLALADSVFLEPTEIVTDKIARLQAIGVAAFAKGETARGEAALKELEPLAKVLVDGKPPYNLDAALMEVRLFRAVAAKDNTEAQKLLQSESAKYYAQEKRAWVQLRLGNLEKAEQAAREAANRKNEVQPLAQLVEVLYRANKKDEAKQKMKELQALSSDVDMTAPIFRRISEIAPELGCSSDWRVVAKPAEDAGKRPPLDSLGPFRWTPSLATNFSLPDMTSKRFSPADYRRDGKPVLVIFYLGSKCAQCMEQLNIFAPVAKDFEKAGISLMAVGTDTVEGLKQTFPKDGAEKRFPFPLLSDKDCKALKAYRAYDDFEKMPLHGCFLIDGQGYVRWQDISFEPFKQTKFLLDEAQRLLKIPATDSPTRVALHTQ